jgi:hypothetical protein
VDPNDPLSKYFPPADADDPLEGFFKESQPKPMTAAPSPITSWEGVTPHLVAAERVAKDAQANGVEMSDADVANHAMSKILNLSTPLSAAVEGLDALEKNVVDPYVIKPFQKHVGGPLLENFIDSQKVLADPKKYVETGKPANIKGAEYLLRSGGQFVAGKGQLDAYGETPKAAQDINDLESKVGPTGAAALATGAQMAGEAPLFLIRGPRLVKALGNGTVVHIAEAAGTGAAMALADPNVSVKEGIAGGAAMGAASSLLEHFYGEIANLLSKNMEPFEQLTPKQILRRKLAKQTDAEVLAKNPKMAKEFEDRLLGVIDRDGLVEVADDLSKAPKQLGAGKPGPKTPSFVTATVDENGSAIIKKSYYQPGGTEMIQSEPLTVESATKAFIDSQSGKYTAVVAPNMGALSMNGGPFKEEVDAFLGMRIKPSMVAERNLRIEDFVDDPDVGLAKTVVQRSNRDYEGTVVKPAAAEVRIKNGIPQITPVFEGETRLPDELPPKVPENTVSMRKPMAPERTVTKKMNIFDKAIIEDKPLIGGGSGNDPLRPKGPPVPEIPAVPQGEPSVENVDPEDLASLDDALAKSKMMLADKTGIGDRALSQIAGRHLRGPTDLATVVTSVQASRMMMKEADDLRVALEKRFGRDLLSKINLDLHKFGEGRITHDEFIGKYPEITREAQEFSRNLFEEKEHWDKWFAERGVVADDLMNVREHGIEDLYMTRRYWAHLLPTGSWGKKLTHPDMHGVLSDGVDQILTDMRKTNKKITADEVAQEVARITNSKDPILSFKQSPIGKPYAALLEKNRELPKAVRDLLGEVRSGHGVLCHDGWHAARQRCVVLAD